MKIFNKKYKKFIVLIIIVFIFMCFCVWQNNSIVVSSLTYSNSKIPKEFHDFKIVHISDLHNKRFGEGQEKIIGHIQSMAPHMIVVTGDLIDRRKYNLQVAIEFIEKAVKVAPVYYVAGNHEAWSGKYGEIKEALIAKGVTVLDDEKTKITKGNSFINIMGVKDPDFLTEDYLDGTNVSQLEKNLNEWKEEAGFKLLLSHRPELLYLYKEYNMDLVFAGHAHGGQIRIPWVGGLVAPDQGFLPKYTSGIYEEDGTSLVVSRGLGNSVFPMRIFNRPEIVEVTLKVEK